MVESRARELFDSLFSNARKTQKPERLLGNIDGLSSRSLTGWVVDQADLDRAVEFIVYVGNKRAGRAVADRYREDLEEAGYGNGRHGFHVLLEIHSLSEPGSEITLVEDGSGETIGTNGFSLDGRENYVAEIKGITDRRIVAEIIGKDSVSEKLSVEFLVDCEFRLPCAETDRTETRVTVEAVLSEDLFDGMPHTYELVINNANCLSSVHIQVTHAITTPEEFLADSIGQDGYPFASGVALQRYQSLARRFEDCMELPDQLENIQNILVAHREMEKGLGKRRSYPRIILPAVKNPEVSIIVSARDHFDSTYHCIASLILAHNTHSYEVILVDDESSDETMHAETYFENITVIRNQNNLGYLMSNRLAAEKARGRYLCLLNNDTEVTAHWIDNALKVFSLYKDVGSVGCKLINRDGSLQEAGGLIWKGGIPWNYGNGQNASHPRYNYVRQADYLSAAALFVKREVWHEVGGFSQEYVPAYYEDTDLACKIREAGYRVFYCPSSVVIHFEGVSNGTDTSTGLKSYQETNASKFRARWHQSFRHHATEGTTPALEVDRWCGQRILVIDANTPRLHHDAGSYAAIQEMKLLLELGSKLVFLPLNMAHMGIHTERLQMLGIECLHYPFYVSIEQVLQQRGAEFDLVYITRYETVHSSIDSIRKYTDAKVIFNNADLHFMRELREELNSENRDLSGPLATRDKELEAINSVDMTLCYTETERAVIASHIFSESDVMRCPWVVQRNSNERSFEQRDGIVFLGGFRHRPNVDAIEYFCNDVMPHLVERLPDLVLYIYGSGMPDEFDKLASPNVNLVGYAENLSDVFSSARVFVCPLLTGAGLNGKIIDCIAHGLPSVVSPLTADGTGLVHRQSTMIAETTEEWADYICELYSNPFVWNQMAERASELTQSLYSGADGVRRMSTILSRLGVYAEASGDRLFTGFAE